MIGFAARAGAPDARVYTTFGPRPDAPQALPGLEQIVRLPERIKQMTSSLSRWFFIAGLCGGMLEVSAADYASTVQSLPNLVGYWRFDLPTPTHSVVHDYTGALVGNARISSPGLGCRLPSESANQCLLLDGNDSYLPTSLSGQIETEGTVLAWVYLAAQPASAGHFFQITSQSAVGNDFDLQIQTDNHVYFFTDAGTATVYPHELPLQEWHFLAATFVANGLRAIYLDGRPVATSTAKAHVVNNTPLWIGNNRTFGPRCFAGRLDEVAVYNRALTAAEIGLAYAAATAPILDITRNEFGQWQVSWSPASGGGTLWSSLDLAGPSMSWQPVGTNNPFVLTPSAWTNRSFFKVIQP